MKKTEFINTLDASLNGMTREEKADILFDYDEHFRIGAENGKTEEEIADSLGDPRFIAKQYKADTAVRRAETNSTVGNISKAVLAAVGMGFFNLVFVLGLYLGLLGALIGLFAAAIGTTAGGVGVILAVLLQPFLPSLVTLGVNPGVALFAGIGTAALGLIFFIGVCYLAKYFFKITIRYLKWNMDIIRK